MLLIGEATKVSDYLLNGDKSYEVTVRLGVRTDSMDITGQVLEERAVDLDEAKVRAAVAGMSGALTLEVPLHSAVKVDGKKLYEFAHKGERPESVPERVMHDRTRLLHRAVGHSDEMENREILGIGARDAVDRAQPHGYCLNNG